MFTDLILLQAEEGHLFGTEFFNLSEFLSLVIRFSFNLLVIGIIVRGLYYSVSKKKNYLFSFMLISTVVFLICFLLDDIGLGIGFALGLFAIFGIIRYRTNPIPIKEMTYLFVVIGISVINGLSNMKISYLELVFTNVITIIVVYLLERIWLIKNEFLKIIDYENVDLIQPGRRAELIKDLKERTKLDITRVEIGRINFLRDSARLRIFYNDDTSEEGGVEIISFDDEND